MSPEPKKPELPLDDEDILLQQQREEGLRLAQEVAAKSEEAEGLLRATKPKVEEGPAPESEPEAEKLPVLPPVKENARREKRRKEKNKKKKSLEDADSDAQESGASAASGSRVRGKKKGSRKVILESEEEDEIGEAKRKRQKARQENIVDPAPQEAAPSEEVPVSTDTVERISLPIVEPDPVAPEQASKASTKEASVVEAPVVPQEQLGEEIEKLEEEIKKIKALIDYLDGVEGIRDAMYGAEDLVNEIQVLEDDIKKEDGYYSPNDIKGFEKELKERRQELAESQAKIRQAEKLGAGVKEENIDDTIDGLKSLEEELAYLVASQGDLANRKKWLAELEEEIRVAESKSDEDRKDYIISDKLRIEDELREYQENTEKSKEKIARLKTALGGLLDASVEDLTFSEPEKGENLEGKAGGSQIVDQQGKDVASASEQIDLAGEEIIASRLGPEKIELNKEGVDVLALGSKKERIEANNKIKDKIVSELRKLRMICVAHEDELRKAGKKPGFFTLEIAKIDKTIAKYQDRSKNKLVNIQKAQEGLNEALEYYEEVMEFKRRKGVDEKKEVAVKPLVADEDSMDDLRGKLEPLFEEDASASKVKKQEAKADQVFEFKLDLDKTTPKVEKIPQKKIEFSLEQKEVIKKTFERFRIIVTALVSSCESFIREFKGQGKNSTIAQGAVRLFEAELRVSQNDARGRISMEWLETSPLDFSEKIRQIEVGIEEREKRLKSYGEVAADFRERIQEQKEAVEEKKIAARKAAADKKSRKPVTEESIGGVEESEEAEDSAGDKKETLNPFKPTFWANAWKRSVDYTKKNWSWNPLNWLEPDKIDMSQAEVVSTYSLNKKIKQEIKGKVMEFLELGKQIKGLEKNLDEYEQKKKKYPGRFVKYPLSQAEYDEKIKKRAEIEKEIRKLKKQLAKAEGK